MLLTQSRRQDTRRAHKQAETSLQRVQGQIGALQTDITDLREVMISSGKQKHNDPIFRALEQILVSIEPVTKRNVHFSMPQSVQSFFTGREELLKELSTSFIQSPGPLYDQDQRRFVIHGIAGSGKTQFCCKFADMNRYKYVYSNVSICMLPSNVSKILGRLLG